jgi:5'-phosphate synthase pdxT subunit
VDSFETDLEVTGLDAPFRAVFIRAPVVERAGEGVEVLASFDGRPVLVRQGRMLGSSFHPEMTGDNRVHSLFVEMVSE